MADHILRGDERDHVLCVDDLLLGKGLRDAGFRPLLLDHAQYSRFLPSHLVYVYALGQLHLFRHGVGGEDSGGKFEK